MGRHSFQSKAKRGVRCVEVRHADLQARMQERQKGEGMNYRTENLVISGICWLTLIVVVVLLATCGGWSGIKAMF